MTIEVQPKVFTKEAGNLELQARLRELSFEMLKTENAKMGAYNNYCFNNEHANGQIGVNPLEDYNRKLSSLDATGYAQSLEFNELLLSEGYVHSGYDDIGPDAIKISTEYLLHQFGLKYPNSWEVVRSDREGLYFGFHLAERIDSDYNIFMTGADFLLSTAKISEEDYARIKAAADYKAAHHKLLSKYLNKEETFAK